MSQGWSYTNGKGLQFYVQPKSGADFSTSWEAAYLIDETTVYSSMLSRNFNPYHYNKDGYMKIMAVTYNTYTLSGFETTDVTLQVLQNHIQYYNHAWLDTSQISAIDFGTTLKEYKVDTQLSNSVNN